MPVAVIQSHALRGLDAPAVSVEVHLANGLPAFNIVGLPDTEVREARDRVRAALSNSQFDFPARRVTVSLAPADLPKSSGRFDLPIALGVLVATAQIPDTSLADYEFAGELALNGELRAVRGALAMVVSARRDARAFVLPAASAEEAARVPGARVYAARSLLEVCGHLTGRAVLARVAATDAPPARGPVPDLADVRGQAHAKRALEIAAAGGHSLLMAGPPGSGKSMLAQRLPGLLPPLDESDALETAAVLSLAGRFDATRWREAPFRAPHHTASGVALVGGGSDPRPGEISLAHNGVLFLDELPEWDRRVLEVLREPLETGAIHISRAARQASFPARFQLIAAMNPCPCGWLGHPHVCCRCAPDRVARYRARVSGPLLDRIDMTIDVPAVAPDALGVRALPVAANEHSDAVRARVAAARDRQRARQQGLNARLDVGAITRHCAPDDGGETLIVRAMARQMLSARAYHRVLRVARTIADLDGADIVGAAHVAEAIGYRCSLDTLFPLESAGG
ncbi:MAG: YifB family Mg chelatase-like AAA ATPase [Casimicrobiaceae bacterium]